MNMAPRRKAPASKPAPANKAAPKKAPASAKAKPKARAKPAAKAKASAKPAPKPKAKASTVKAKPAAVKAKPATAKAKLSVAKKKAAPKASLAREARKAAAMKKAIERVIAPIENDTAVVEAYMRDLDHPFKAEIEAVRAIVLGASNKLSERIKWNAPSFYYKADDLAAFNPRASEYAHLLLLFPDGIGIPAKSTVLEGKAKDRREAKFMSLEDVQAKKPALEKLIKAWLKLRD
jgi:Domain of unknown function (DU1801)